MVWLAVLAWIASGWWTVAAVEAQSHRTERAHVDGLAALVGGRAPGPDVETILLSDVDLRARLALNGQTEGSLPLGPLPATLLGATLTQIVGEALIRREAIRVRAAQPGQMEVARERQQLEQGAGGRERMRALLEALSVSEREVDAIAERRALVAAFLEGNLEGTTTVTEAEVERLYEMERQDGNELGEEALGERVRARLRHQLAREALDRTIAHWVSALRARTTVQLLAPYAEHVQ